MAKKKIKEVLVSALIGALVTFLMHIVEALTGIQTKGTEAEVGGLASSIAYLKLTFSRFI